MGLSNNKISGEDFENFANSIRNNKNLLSLDLKWNELGTKGGLALKKALDSNDIMIYLGITLIIICYFCKLQTVNCTKSVNCGNW